MRRLTFWVIMLAALGGAGAAGWIVGADVVAPQPTSEDQTVADAASGGRVQIEVDRSAHPNESLILGASRLSPFGNAEGLQGRQILSGRVVSISDGSLTLETPTGRAEIRLTDETTFLLRMVAVDPSTIGAGAAVSIVLDDDGETALSALALPANSRPSLNAPDPPSPGGD